jgi:hypothetical protein
MDRSHRHDSDDSPTHARQQGLTKEERERFGSSDSPALGSIPERDPLEYSFGDVDFHILNQQIQTEMNIRDLPRATRIVFTIVAEGKDPPEPLAWAGCNLYTYAKVFEVCGS